jgi:hypothetical protein
LTEIRGDDPNGYGALPANLSRWTLAKIEQAFSGFFKRVKVNKKKAGFPRFRSISRWNSFGFVEWSGIRLDGDTLDFKGLTGGLKVHLHRDLPFGATIKSCVFTKRDRHWVVSLQIEVPEVATVHRGVGNAIGLDWGVETFATLSNGDRIENPRLGTDAAAAVRIAARKLSRAWFEAQVEDESTSGAPAAALGEPPTHASASGQRRTDEALRLYRRRGFADYQYDRVRQRHGRTTRNQRPAKSRTEQGDSRYKSEHADGDAALQS